MEQFVKLQTYDEYGLTAYIVKPKGYLNNNCNEIYFCLSSIATALDIHLDKLKEFISYDIQLKSNTGLIIDKETYDNAILAINSKTLLPLFRKISVHIDPILIQITINQCNKLLVHTENYDNYR